MLGLAYEEFKTAILTILQILKENKLKELIETMKKKAER